VIIHISDNNLPIKSTGQPDPVRESVKIPHGTENQPCRIINGTGIFFLDYLYRNRAVLRHFHQNTAPAILPGCRFPGDPFCDSFSSEKVFAAPFFLPSGKKSSQTGASPGSLKNRHNLSLFYPPIRRVFPHHRQDYPGCESAMKTG